MLIFAMLLFLRTNAILLQQQHYNTLGPAFCHVALHCGQDDLIASFTDTSTS